MNQRPPRSQSQTSQSLTPSSQALPGDSNPGPGGDGRDQATFKIGDLARRTGLTVRTLHHYDAIGLLSPGQRTAAGHRLYGFDELERLQRVLSLRQLGFSLEEIGDCLDRRDFSLLSVLELHVARLRERLEHERRLCDRLETVVRHLRAGDRISTDDLITTLEVTTMFEKHYTPEQLQQLAERRDALGPEGMAKAQDDWTTLIAEVRQAMEQGAEPDSEEVQALAARWQSLIDAFTGGDPGIEAGLRKVYTEAPQQAESLGAPDAAMRSFIARALALAS